MGEKKDTVWRRIDLMAAAYDRSLREVLAALETAFDASEKRLAEPEESNESADYKQFIAEEEARLRQALFGTAFVVCQAYIAAVIAHARRLSESLREDGSPNFLPATREKLFNAVGADIVLGTEYSKVELICELANYFKHSDEWAEDQWDRPADKGRGYTVKVLLACGLENNGKVLEQGARVLGVRRGQWLAELDSIFSEWSHRVAQAAKAERKD
jgi:hypothetical protein